MLDNTSSEGKSWSYSQLCWSLIAFIWDVVNGKMECSLRYLKTRSLRLQQLERNSVPNKERLNRESSRIEWEITWSETTSGVGWFLEKVDPPLIRSINLWTTTKIIQLLSRSNPSNMRLHSNYLLSESVQFR